MNTWLIDVLATQIRKSTHMTVRVTESAKGKTLSIGSVTLFTQANEDAPVRDRDNFVAVSFANAVRDVREIVEEYSL